METDRRDSKASRGHGEPCRHPFRLPVYDRATHERFAATGERPIARCRWCSSCVRISEREWVRSIHEEAARSGGGFVGYMVLSISTNGLTDVEVYERLVRCRTLFLKRLRSRYPRKWKSLLWRLEAGESGHFPHLNVVLFGWRYVPKRTLHSMWGDVTELVTGTRASADRIAAVGYQDVGRLSRYTFKEALTGLAAYTWKEGRPVWLPKRRRLWAKSPGSCVSAWPKQRRTTATVADASRGQQAFDGSRALQVRELLGLAMSAAVPLLADLPPPLQLALF